jgi:hypothetical protein
VLATLVGLVGALPHLGSFLLGAIDWTKMTEGLKTAFETGVETVLPIAGIILAAFITFKAIRRFVKT